VIILDVMMPMVDGFATLEQIKDERLRHCKVIPFGKKQRKHIEKDFALGAIYMWSNLFSQKISRTSTGFNSIRNKFNTMKYEEIYTRSIDQPEAFWAAQADD
jgi:CheY-like chemotaxis protein